VFLILGIVHQQTTAADPCEGNTIPMANKPDPDDCQKYYLCMGSMAVPLDCEEGQNFDVNTADCTDADKAVCFAPEEVKTTTKGTRDKILLVLKINSHYYFF
jgi:hypothetical protein